MKNFFYLTYILRAVQFFANYTRTRLDIDFPELENIAKILNFRVYSHRKKRRKGAEHQFFIPE